MRIIGADLREIDVAVGAAIVALDDRGSVAAAVRAFDLSGLAREVAKLAAGDPYLLAVDVPVASRERRRVVSTAGCAAASAATGRAPVSGAT
jgi:hypothetical protein